MDVIARFWAKVDKRTPTECWNWTAACFKDRRGYGAFGVTQGVIVRAHRFSYELHVQEIPEAQHVLHRCDNPKCVNPHHLFLGDHAINNADMRDKGRSARKLDAEKVRSIRASALSSRTLAKIHGVSQHMIMRVIHRKAWAHIA
jgi:hypothetical protein